jgi:hypothetical protein
MTFLIPEMQLPINECEKELVALKLFKQGLKNIKHDKRQKSR